ncbi:MAG: Rieske 2Fe-2S domain-containing protein [Proteobacteria bacterium]|nr:Rieske 2Fe-2S domain-containing protein [Pseudomonadota bacterium]
MLSNSNNELISRVGPGTSMGNLLRRFWVPALLEEEIAEPDSPPVRLRLFGEDLVAFKDSDGEVGILDEHCRHRQVSLYFGRNEECGLRCVYHGWKFDVQGNCVDMPSEPNPSKSLMAKAKLQAYPTALRGGVVWVYMGPADKMPQLPAFEWSNLPPMHRIATKRKQHNNWAQAVEGGIDSAHISYLHSKIDPDHPVNEGLPGRGQGGDRHPVFDVRDVDYGLLIAARRDLDAANYYYRITQFLLPFYTMIPGPVRKAPDEDIYYGGHAWVPIDDDSTWTWSFGVRAGRPFTEKEHAFMGGKDGYWGPVDDEYNSLHKAENDYLMDRDVQAVGNYTGIRGIPNQDAAVQESMGSIVDRSRELLGHSDTAIIKLIQMAQDLEKGIEPAAPHYGEWYNVRSVSVNLERDTDWVEGAKPYFPGTAMKVAAE